MQARPRSISLSQIDPACSSFTAAALSVVGLLSPFSVHALHQLLGIEYYIKSSAVSYNPHAYQLFLWKRKRRRAFLLKPNSSGYVQFLIQMSVGVPQLFDF